MYVRASLLKNNTSGHIFLIGICTSICIALHFQMAFGDDATSQSNIITNLIVPYVTAASLIGALVFSGVQQFKQRKNDYYNVFKDLYHEFSAIEKDVPPISKYINLHQNDLKKQEEDIRFKTEYYRWEFLSFHEKVAHLALSGLIPKKIARYYDSTFYDALSYVELYSDPAKIKENLTHIMQWCEQEQLLKNKTNS